LVGNAILSCITLWMVFGNLIAIITFVLPRNKHLRTSTNLVILNLAVTDFLFGIVSFPIFTQNWRAGDFSSGQACFVLGIMSVVLATESVELITLIALERFLSIVLERHISRSSLLPALCVSWLLAILFGCLGLIEGKGPGVTPCGYFCAPHWNESIIQSAFCVSVLGITMSITAYLYFRIFRKVKMMHRNMRQVITIIPAGGFGSEREGESARSTDAETEIGKRMAVIVVMFALNWFTYALLIIYESVSGHEASAAFDAVATTLAYTNSALNPVLYFILDPRFRRAIRDFVCGVSYGLPDGVSRTGYGLPDGVSQTGTVHKSSISLLASTSPRVSLSQTSHNYHATATLRASFRHNPVGSSHPPTNLRVTFEADAVQTSLPSPAPAPSPALSPAPAPSPALSSAPSQTHMPLTDPLSLR